MAKGTADGGAATGTGQEKVQDKASGKGAGDVAAAAAGEEEQLVIRAPVHCDGCGRKLRRSLQRLEGVGEVTVDSRTNTVVVRGCKAVENSTKVVQVVERRTGEKAVLVSPSPEKLPPRSAAKGGETNRKDDANKKDMADELPEVNTSFGHIDILVSNAAANPSVDGILEMKESVLDKLWDINVKAFILLLPDAASHLRKGSSVIIISSIAGYNPEQGLSMYGVTKTALFGLTKALAAEMGPNTRVNCIAPGFVPTRFASFLTENETLRKELNERSKLKRLGTVEDMAAAAAFLASDDASYITAETIVVAGGTQSRL